MSSQLITSFIPQTKVVDAENSNASVIDRLGESVIRNVVRSILEGGNLRDLTEVMTRKRILLSNAALLVMYFRLLGADSAIEDKLTGLVEAELMLPSRKVPASKKEYLLALIGMTHKGWDNIVRRDFGKKAYLTKLGESLKDIEREICEEFGSFEAELRIEGQKRTFPTASVLRCMMALGSQTLAIRGSEKSIYGKLFERLVLGSVLSILGFRKIERNDYSGIKKVFWLSDPKDKRECDATAIVSPGNCVRFDIGFIGRGNSEISLDKVTRYGRFLELSSQNGTKTRVESKTIIIVDTIGEGSRLREMAREIGGAIIQMNGSYWVKELSDTIAKMSSGNYKDPLSKISAHESLEFIHREMLKVGFSSFLPKKAIRASKAMSRPRLKILKDIDPGSQYKEYLPMYSLKAACGVLGQSEPVSPEGWIKAVGIGKLDRTMLVVQAVGDSMEPVIHDGEFCVVRRIGGVDYNNRIVLVQHNDKSSDPESGGSFLLKKYIKRGERAVLQSLNPQYSDIKVTESSDLSIVAYLHKKLDV